MKTLNLIFSSQSSLAVELNDISILNMIPFVSRVEGHIQSGRAHSILEEISFDKFNRLIPAEREKYTDELLQLGKSIIEIESFNLASSQGRVGPVKTSSRGL
ncbi:hypothetical protein S699_000354 [Salmonella enterica subsp. enterica]|nr:hypothetical protein [Salmonella enterica]ECC3312156.1 hypothetical protein [Salmonella enterica subsp. enterica]EDR2819028.1 hypothetical protein [Salmonella enterica subsp. enterica]EEJ9202741.1 hypothetical protein [Salmonella enterica subsp. enterica serovar Newport]EJV0313824.1 hypothetical protein [Salmonella enterica]